MRVKVPRKAGDRADVRIDRVLRETSNAQIIDHALA